MKNTKEITTGAMLLAIFGAILLIDRQFSFFFLEFLVFIVPVLIIVFGNMYDLKGGLIFSVCVLLITLVLSPTIPSFFYIFSGLIIGNVYNLLLKKKVDFKVLFIIVSLVFIIVIVLEMSVINPLYFNNSLMKEIEFMLETLEKIFPSINDTLATQGVSLRNIVKTVLMASLIITGIMETLIVYLLTTVLFKRLKIKDVQIFSKRIIVLNPVLAYILFAGASLSLFYNKVSENLSSVFIIISCICIFILAYYGYIYTLLYLKVKYDKRAIIFLIIGIVLFLPLSIYLLMFVGFLYGAGTLKIGSKERKLDEKDKTI